MSDEANQSRLQYLLKLEHVFYKLGLNRCLVYHPCFVPDQKHLLVMMGQELIKHLPEQPAEYTRLYLKLGKTPEVDSMYFIGEGNA